MQGCDDPQLSITTEFGREGVLVSVRDCGSGIAPQVAARLFQPFATGKQRGMGLGLRICQTIVEAHGGRIWAVPGTGGATFRFSLPLCRPELIG
jgi:signal transduction histidine kinase